MAGCFFARRTIVQNTFLHFVQCARYSYILTVLCRQSFDFFIFPSQAAIFTFCPDSVACRNSMLERCCHSSRILLFSTPKIPQVPRFPRCKKHRSPGGVCAFCLWQPDICIINRSMPIPKESRPQWGRDSFGAGNRNRTGTDFTPRDFKSLVSTYSTMPASLSYRNTNFLFRQGEERRILGKITTAVGI